MRRVASVLGILAVGGAIGVGLDRLWLANAPRHPAGSTALAPQEPVPSLRSPAELLQGTWVATAVEHRGLQPEDLKALVRGGGLKYRITTDRLDCQIADGGSNGYRLDLANRPARIEFFDAASGWVTRRGIFEVTTDGLRLCTNNRSGDDREPHWPRTFDLAQAGPDDNPMLIVLKRQE